MSPTPFKAHDDFNEEEAYALDSRFIYFQQHIQMFSMRFLSIVLLSCFLLSCDSEVAVQNLDTSVTDDANATGSFRAGGNRRERLFAAAEEQGIELWINEDGSVGYYLADGDAIDDILDWIRAVNWVNN